MYAVDSVGRLAMAFLPIGVSDPSLKLNLDNLGGFTGVSPWVSVWYNPRSSCTCSATAISNGGTTWTFTRPNSAVDWALIIRNTNFMAGLGVGACVSADCP